MEKLEYKILKTTTGLTYNLPIFLGQGIKDLGQMIGFDGEISQIEQKCNFTYSGSSNNIKIYNTVNMRAARQLLRQLLAHALHNYKGEAYPLE